MGRVTPETREAILRTKGEVCRRDGYGATSGGSAIYEAVLDHGRTEVTISDGLDDAQELVNALSELGIEMKAVTDQLLAEGVDAFAKSFEQLMDNLASKQEQLAAKT